MTQTAIMEDLQKTEESLAPVIDFQAMKEKLEKECETDKVGPYSSRYQNPSACCPCPHYPAPMWPAYPYWPYHFPQRYYYPDWTYRSYLVYPGVFWSATAN